MSLVPLGQPEDLVLGVDSGGTKTLAAVARRDGTVIAMLRGGSLDPVSVPDWPQRLQRLIGGFGGDVKGLTASVLGLSCHGEIASLSQDQDRIAATLLPGAVVVDNDVRIAFDGAFAGEMGGRGGALILAGTGSMAWASLGGPHDPHVRSGGWGDVFGDEGSAHWIGKEALAATSRELDGRMPASGFSGSVLRVLGIGPEGLLNWCYMQDHRRAAIADLARHVAAFGAAGDPVARAILLSAADELAATLLAAWRKAAGERPLTWTFAGGVTANAEMLARIAERVGTGPQVCRLPPVGGALWRAARKAGWAITEAWLDRVAETLRSVAVREIEPFARQGDQLAGL